MTEHYDFSLETKALGETGEFEGYASTFGNVDQGGDLVEVGAFLDGLKRAEREKRSIPMLWMHDQREPIGIWSEVSEDGKGLRVRGKLLIDVDPLAKRAHALLQAKALGGLSIGYRVPAGGAEEDKERPGVVRLKKVDLREISLVTMPMNIQARFTSVKSMMEAGRMPTTLEFEDFLQEAGGFSKSLAAAIAGKAAPHLRGEPEAKASDPAAFLRAMLRTD